MQIKKLSLIILPLFLIVTGCHHTADLSMAPSRPAPPGPEFKCSHDSVYFMNSVYPLILTGCAKSGCHDNQNEEIVLDGYQNIMRMVVPFDPQGSQLYRVLFSNEEERMPRDQPFTTEQKSIIYWWISQGAMNNRCDSTGCDTVQVTYTGSIVPIINTWCISCHSGNNPGGGFNLDSYNGVSAVADNGKLTGAIRHEPGFSAMPKGGPMLSACALSTFEIWIRNGKP
ncbi:MAG: hypothetical protein ACM3N9_06195 [Syntrophothermus sp.]